MALRVLIIDDDPDLIETTRDILQSEDYEVLVAVTGHDGLMKAAQEKPNLILLDLSLPDGMDGFEVCEKIKADPLTAAIPIIVLTGKDTGDEVEKALQKKADWFIAKPYDVRYLLKQVKQHIVR